MREGSLFITGAGGYVGRRLLSLVEPGAFQEIYRLVRSVPGPMGPGENVQGDLLDPSTYSQALSRCDTVIHLAAVTGKHKPGEYFRTNREGTRVLVEACERAGVRHFLHVSTIAVKYPDLSGYHYAQAKREAEEIVRASHMRWTIVRPTMIFGPGAPVFVNLSKLALAPVIPLFGGGQARVQPVYVDDLARLLLSIAEGRLDGGVIEAGGPEALMMRELLARIRFLATGRRGRAVRFPMGLVGPAVRLADAALGPLMPVTAGQLKALTMDGVADRACGAATALDDAVRLSLAGEQLRRECATYTRYLIQSGPSAYVTAKYEEFHRQMPGAAVLPAGRFDSLLVGLAARSPLMTRLAEAYASRFYRASALRRKLVLLLGLLESAQPSAAHLDSPGARSRAGAWTGLAGSALKYAAALAVSVVVFAPLHVALGSRRAA